VKTPSAYAIHDYTAKIRASVWFTFVDGEIETDRPVDGRRVGIELDGDLGYDDPYPTYAIEAAFRHNRHDFWITGTRFDEGETAPIGVTFTIGDQVFETGGKVKTKAELTDVDFRYGYSFYTYEEDGFRFGPTIAVSYTKFDVKVKEITISDISLAADWSLEEETPVPTIGLNLEIPYNEFLFTGRIGGFYFDADDIEGTGVRSELSATWRPYENVGFYAGFYAFYADLELKNEDIDDLLLYGPSVGIELRF